MGVIQLYSFLTILAFAQSSSKTIFSKIDEFEGLLFTDSKIFTELVMNYYDCMLLCSYQSDCLSVVYAQTEGSDDLCTGYAIVFQNESASILYSHASYYALTHSECPASYYFDTTGNICMKTYLDQSLTSTEAEVFCKKDGGSLSIIDTPEKQAAVVNYWTSFDNHMNMTTSVLIGGFRKNKEAWFWSNGNAFEYSNWLEGHPLNVDKKDCLKVRITQQFKWASSECHKERHFLCERQVL